MLASNGASQLHSEVVPRTNSVCEERYQRVLLVDADMQANMNGTFVEKADREPGIKAYFDPTQDADAKSLVRPTKFPHIDVVPANTRLVRFDMADRHAWEKTELHPSLVEPVSTLRSSYDYVVFDCPPRLSVVNFTAHCASDYVVIPLEAADFGQWRSNPHTILMEPIPCLSVASFLGNAVLHCRCKQDAPTGLIWRRLTRICSWSRRG